MKIVQTIKKLNSISRARLNFRRRPFLCTVSPCTRRQFSGRGQTLLLTYWTTTNLLFRTLTWRRMRTDSTGQRNKRQIAVSISWTHREPRGLVGSRCDVGSSGTQFESHRGQRLFLCHFFFSECGQRKFQRLSHVRRWLPHMHTSEVYSNLPAG